MTSLGSIMAECFFVFMMVIVVRESLNDSLERLAQKLSEEYDIMDAYVCLLSMGLYKFVWYVVIPFH